MPTVDNLNIQINASANSAMKSIDALTRKLNTLSGSLKVAMGSVSKNNSKITVSNSKMVSGLNKTTRAMDKTSKSAKSLAASFGLFYANFFLVIRAFKTLWSSIESTADYIEAFNYFNVALGKIGSDWEHQFEQYGYESADAYAKSFSARLQQSLGQLSGISLTTTEEGKGLLSESGLTNLGMNIKEITQYASQLASVTNSVGQTGETSLAIASSFTKLAGDISSLFNVDYSAVSKNLQSGLIGQSRALYKYGIDITNATLQTYAYGLGLEKAVSEMTQAEKMQLRVLAILDQSKVSWGDLANTIESPSNQIRIFKNNLSELGMIIGQLFVPLLSKLLPVLNGISVALKRVFVDMAALFGVQLDMDAFGQGYTDLEDDIDGITDGLEDATDATKKFKNATLGIDELNILNKDDSSSAVGSDTLDLTNQIIEATKGYEKAWADAFDEMERRISSFADKFEKALEPVKQLFTHLFTGDFGAVGQDLSNMVKGLFDFITRALEKIDWNEVGRKFGEFLKGIEWISVLDAVGQAFWVGLSGAISAYVSMFDAAPIETTIISALLLLNYTKMGQIVLEKFGAALAGVIVTYGTKLLTIIMQILPTILNGLSYAFAVVNPGMWGELYIRLERALEGTIFDPESWTGLPRKIYDSYNKAIDDMLAFFDEQMKAVGEAFARIFSFDTAISMLNSSSANFGIGGNIVLGIAEGIGGALYLLIEPIVNLFNYTWETICGVFGIHSPAESMNPIGKYILLGIVEGFESSFGNFFASISTLWGKLSSSWFIKSKWTFGGIKDGLSESFNSAVASIKQIWNKFATWLNSKLTFGWEGVPWLGIEGGSITLGQLPTFATGGFPEDGLFMANHGELVGGFSNGKTAVANNEQIVEGIRYGVREAVSEVLAPYLADIARNTRETADKDFATYIGDREIAKANNRGQRQLGAMLIT